MKINVAVLFGGKSVEHEVSVISALQAMQNMNKDKYQLYPVYITKKNELYYGEDLDKIDEYKNIPRLLEKSTKINIVTDGDKTYLLPQQQKLFSKQQIVMYRSFHNQLFQDHRPSHRLRTLPATIVFPAPTYPDL